MDQVIKDGVVQPHLEHETRVASRIVHGRNDIAVHFVRRMYGNQQDVFNVAKVIENFSARGVKIVNMSFGSDCGVLPLEERAWSQIFKKYSQIIFVVAAGNSGRNLDHFDYCPAKYSRDNDNVISVTSATQDGVISVNYDPEAGSDVLMNYGISVDVAIRADNLSVLVPLQYDEDSLWINHSTGWTSHAAAEVTRVIAHAMADGYPVDPRRVKAQLINTSRKSRYLREFVTSGGIVDEVEFRASLARPSQKNY
jgi:subtilisin family serine protease